MPINRRLLCGLAAATLLLPLGAASAQEYPSKPIQIIVPFSAAGVTDIVARIVFDHVSNTIGQRAVIENRVGAGGTIGMEAAARAPADGYTLVFGDASGSTAANVTLYPKAGFNPQTDLTPVALLGITGAVLVVPSELPVKTFGEFVAYSKSKKDGLLYGSVGVGTPGHMNAELLKLRTGIGGSHIPYRSISQGVSDLISNRLAFWIPPLPTGLPHIRSGKLRALAFSGEERSRDLPDVPTFKELGVKDFDVSSTYAVFAPAGTPAPVIAKLYANIKAALEDPQVRERLLTAGVQPKLENGAYVSDLVRTSVKQWADVIRSAGIPLATK